MVLTALLLLVLTCLRAAVLVMVLACLWSEPVIVGLLLVAVAVLVAEVVRLLYLGSPAMDVLELPVVTSARLEYPIECLLLSLP